MANQNDNHGAHFIVPQTVLIRTLLALLVLTIITVTTSRIDFGFMNTVIAMLIASVKAGLVMSFFMGLKYDNMLNRAIFLCGFFFLALLWGYSVLDIWTRVNPRS